MNRVESLLRAAARDEAAETGPESVPSFSEARLPQPRRPLLWSRHWSKRRSKRWSRQRPGLLRGPLSFASSPNPYQQAVTDDVFPFLLWTSHAAKVTIGLTDGGHAVVVRDGHVKRIAWPLNIAIPFDGNVPGAAW